MKTETLPVYGMTCQHCVKAVTKALSKIEGVAEVSVLLEESCASISYDEDITDRKVLENAILKEDFYLTPPAPVLTSPPASQKIKTQENSNTTDKKNTRINLSVEGMTCANCANNCCLCKSSV